MCGYLDMCNDLDLTMEQKPKIFHNMFADEAKRFYRENIDGVATTFAEATSIMTEEYNSITRQNRCRRKLQKLRMARAMKRR